jgi:type I restriction enzyme S subunit
MTEWRICTIGDLGEVVTGTTPRARHPEWFGDCTDFITPSDISAEDRRARPQRMLSAEGVQQLKGRLLPAGSVGFVSIGATIGKLCLLESPAISNQQINAVVPHSDTNGRFVRPYPRKLGGSSTQRASGHSSGALLPRD